MKFEYLSERQEYISVVADWFHSEWSHLNPSRTKEDIIKVILSHLSKENLPIVFVGIDNHEVIGTVSLRKFEMENFEHLYPWLSSLYVPEEKRMRGIGNFLVNHCLEKARELGERNVYLFTENHEDWYKKMGWRTLEKVIHRKHSATIMQITL